MQLALPSSPRDCKTRKDTTYCKTNQILHIEPPTNNGSNIKQLMDRNRTTTFERTSVYLATEGGGLNAFYWRQIFDQDSVVVKTQKIV